MLTKIPASARHHFDHGWVSGYWLFSFAEYYDPRNLNFGGLRVFNADTIQPNQGFGLHPHKNMEIVTIIRAGQVTHTDDLGNATKIATGEVQRMSAGTGVLHSEMNLEKEPLKLWQIWLPPARQNDAPSYAQASFAERWHAGQPLLPVVSGSGAAGALPIFTDAEIWLGKLSSNETTIYTAKEANRALFIYLESGSLLVNGLRLAAGDQLRASAESELHITATVASEFILVDTPI